MAGWMSGGTKGTKSPWVSVVLHKENNAAEIELLKIKGYEIYGD